MAELKTPGQRVPSYMLASDGSIDWDAKPGVPARTKAEREKAPALKPMPQNLPAPVIPARQSYADYDRQQAARSEGQGKQFLRGFGQGATYGWGDEIMEPSAPGYSERYAEGAKKYPATNFAGELTGSLVTPANRAVSMGLWKYLPSGGALGNASTRAAIVGGAHGVLAGAGGYDPAPRSLSDRVLDAGAGGLVSGGMSALTIPAATAVAPRVLRTAPAGAMDEALSRDAATYRASLRPTPDRLERIPRGTPLAANTGGSETRALIGQATSTPAGARVIERDATKTAAGAVGRTVGALKAVNPQGAKPSLTDDMVKAMSRAFFDADRGIHQDWTSRISGRTKTNLKGKSTTYAPMNAADKARIAERVAADIQARIEKDPASASKILDSLQTPMMQERVTALVGKGKFRTPSGSSTAARTGRKQLVDKANTAYEREPRQVPLTHASAERVAREAITPRDYLYVPQSDRTDPITQRTLRPGFMSSDYTAFSKRLPLDESGRPVTLTSPYYWLTDIASMPGGHFGREVVDTVRGADGVYRDRGGYLR